MSRGLWFAAGAGAGIWTMVRGRRAVEALSADGLRDRLGAAVLGARMFGEEVATGRAEAETRLRADLDLRAHGRPELAASPAPGPAPAAPPTTTPTTPTTTHPESEH